ncbi:hypothetical protein QP568_02450 [Propionimicrobium lymphophilum]|uniref:hypothetical protein n=1 Tax=Propionimicrobium lymphophilum TaxID=33012 RepID=UPI00254A1D02|nr:hypothetical protein [Propionimicrobium lymphophilum]MDK7709171.1 hypothetical protein [Propionimicrobium lymphophilum]MDK7733159.1 hypothetical protein [Propionimicrobium lymphophilum]
MTAILLTWLIHDHEAVPAVRTDLLAHWLGFLPFPPSFMPAGGRAKPSTSTSPNRAGTPAAHPLNHH